MSVEAGAAIAATEQGAAEQSTTLLTEGVQPAGQDAQAGAEQNTGTEKPGEGGDPKTEQQPAKDVDPATIVPEKADGYQIDLPKGTSVDEGLLASFKALAHENGLPQGTAQKLAGLYAEHVAKGQEAHAATLRTAVDGWEAEIKASPTFAADKTNAQRTLAQYGSPELINVMNETLIGSHPAVFKFMASIGKALAEPDFKGGGAGADTRTAAQILYPDHK